MSGPLFDLVTTNDQRILAHLLNDPGDVLRNNVFECALTYHGRNFAACFQRTTRSWSVFLVDEIDDPTGWSRRAYPLAWNMNTKRSNIREGVGCVDDCLSWARRRIEEIVDAERLRAQVAQWVAPEQAQAVMEHHAHAQRLATARRQRAEHEKQEERKRQQQQIVEAMRERVTRYVEAHGCPVCGTQSWDVDSDTVGEIECWQLTCEGCQRSLWIEIDEHSLERS